MNLSPRKTWVLLDVSNSAHRAFHTTGSLAFGEDLTGVMYGVLRDVIYLRDQFKPHGFVFAFDSNKSLRRQRVPTYKARRLGPVSEEDQVARGELARQVGLLRREHLSALGFNNVFMASGYEADDVIASVVLNLPDREGAVIVSSDKDLYQLLDGDRIVQFHQQTKKMMTAGSFREEYGTSCSEWPKVKALAGCASDEVIGIDGVGEKTAVKYLTGQLKTESKAHVRITGADPEWFLKTNLPLVKLPYEGCPAYVPLNDHTSDERWGEVLRSLGMENLLSRAVRSVSVPTQGRGRKRVE